MLSPAAPPSSRGGGGEMITLRPYPRAPAGASLIAKHLPPRAGAFACPLSAPPVTLGAVAESISETEVPQKPPAPPVPPPARTPVRAPTTVSDRIAAWIQHPSVPHMQTIV